MASISPEFSLSAFTPLAEILPPGTLGVVDILKAFSAIPQEGPFPMAALEAALAAREVLTPILLALVDRTPEQVLEAIDRSDEADEGTEYFTHVIAMFLLAAHGEQQAFRRILRFFHRNAETDGALSGETALYVTGDLVTEELPSLLAATFDGEIGPLLAMSGDAACDEFSRLAGVQTLFQLVAAGKMPRDEALAYIGNLLVRFRAEEAEAPKGEMFWACFVMTASRFASPQLRPRLDAIFQDGLISAQEMTASDLDKEYAKPWDEHVADEYRPEQLAGLAGYLPKRLDWVAPYGARPGEVEPGRDNTEANLQALRNLRDVFQILEWTKPEPVKRAAPKTGRNEPCPCGSAKKYKKCCLGEE